MESRCGDTSLTYHRDVVGPEREILERAVRTIAEQAAKTDAIVDEALAAGLDGSDRSPST
jgi:hypothetical protein